MRIAAQAVRDGRGKTENNAWAGEAFFFYGGTLCVSSVPVCFVINRVVAGEWRKDPLIEDRGRRSKAQELTGRTSTRIGDARRDLCISSCFSDYFDRRRGAALPLLLLDWFAFRANYSGDTATAFRDSDESNPACSERNVGTRGSEWLKSNPNDSGQVRNSESREMRVRSENNGRGGRTWSPGSSSVERPFCCSRPRPRRSIRACLSPLKHKQRRTAINISAARNIS